MVDDIPMGNAPFINIPSSSSPIETIPSWARQMFGATEQKLNEHAVQMAEFKREQETDRAELKKEQKSLMADFRVIMFESKTPPAPAPIPAPTPAPPVASPAPAFTFTTERKEILPKLPTYHGVKKEFQPWYFQARTKFQVDFTHLSDRDRFFYIHNRQKDKTLK